MDTDRSIFKVLAAIAFMPFAVTAFSLPANAATWVKVNGGNPLYHEGAFIGSARNGRGDVFYFINDNRNQTICGRVRAGSFEWGLYSHGGFSNAECLPFSISNTNAKFDRIRLFPCPDNQDGLIGVGNWPFAGLIYGGMTLDIHGNFGNLLFDGAQWKKWKGGKTYSTGYMSALIYPSWSTVTADFDFNPDDGTGILAGTQGGMDGGKGLHFTKFDYFDASCKWRMWKNGGWGANNSLPNPLSDGYPVYSQIDLTKEGFGQPTVAHIGAGNYLFVVTFNDSTRQFPTAIRYSDAAGSWQMWDGASWQGPAGTFGPVSNIVTAFVNSRLVSVADGTASYFNAAPGYDLIEIPYDEANGFFGPATVVGPKAKSYAVAVDDQKTIWLFWEDAGNVYLKKKTPGGTWTANTPIYTAPGARVVSAEFLGGRPVCFIRELAGNFALSDAAWSENPLNVAAPQDSPVDPEKLAFKSRVPVRAPGSFYASWGVGPLALDLDGYLYAPQSGVCQVTVRHKDDLDYTLAKSWGYFWDHFSCPGGAAVDNTRGKVYVSSGLIATGSGNIKKVGNVRAFDVAARSESMGWKSIVGHSPPTHWNRAYHAQVFDSLAWPADVAVNEALGRLYVVESLENRVRVYDIENTTDLEGATNAFKVSDLKDGVNAANQPRVDAIVAALVAHGDLGWGDGGQTMVYWISHDLSAVLAYIESLAPYQAMPNNIQRSALVRNLTATYKAVRDLPVHIATIGGTEGSGNGQFSFPQGVAVDPDGCIYVADTLNHRIQKFDFNGNFLKTWGGYGLGESDMLYPFGVAADPVFNLIYVTDPSNRRVLIHDRDGRHVYSFTLTATSVVSDGNANLYVGIGAAEGGHYHVHKYALVDPDVDLDHDGIPDSLQRKVTPDLVAQDVHLTINEDEPGTVELKATGADADTYYEIVLHPQHGTVSLSDKMLTYTPALNYNGDDSFLYRARRGDSDVSNIASGMITINPVNDPPVANDVQATCYKNFLLFPQLDVADPDANDTLAYETVQHPAHGTLIGGYPSIIYIPHQDFLGGDSFVFRVTDAAGASDTATVTITVIERPQMPAPTITPDGTIFNDGEEVVVTLAVSGETGGTPRIYYTLDGSDPTENSNTYAAPFIVNDTVTVRARTFDTGKMHPPSDIVSAAFQKNRGPVANAGDDQSLRLGQTATLAGSATDDGLPNGTLTYEWSVIDAPGNVIIADTGAPKTTASFDKDGVYTLRLTVSDGMASSFDEVTIRVIKAITINPNLSGATTTTSTLTAAGDLTK